MVDLCSGAGAAFRSCQAEGRQAGLHSGGRGTAGSQGAAWVGRTGCSRALQQGPRPRHREGRLGQESRLRRAAASPAGLLALELNPGSVT